METLQLLACPECKSSLSLHAQTELWCKVCGLAFPIRDGIPIMLTDEARALTADEKLG